jgi:two-component system OmpR family response regulator
VTFESVGPAVEQKAAKAKRSILVIDDDRRVLELLQISLTQNGFRVATAGTGEEGLELVRKDAPDLVILDLRLPKKTGFEVCAALKSSKDTAQIPVIMVSASAEVDSRLQGLMHGADDYLTKPFSFAVLLARLRALTRRGSTPRPVVLTVGDLVLDPVSRDVSRDGTRIELTSREFAVLSFLMRRAGEVVSKAQIIEAVWDFSFDGDPNIVEVYIGHLRAKVDRPFGRTSFRTVRGAGYKIDADG